MNDTDFFSSSDYIFLPTKNNPKVALPISNAKYLDLATPVPTDVGIEANHISDGYKDISIPVPTAADVNIPIPSAKDAVIPD